MDAPTDVRPVRRVAFAVAPFVMIIALSTIIENAAHQAAWAENPWGGTTAASYMVRRAQITWHTLLWNNVVFWGLWALATPLIVATARVLMTVTLQRRLLSWIVLGVAASALHALLTDVLSNLPGSNSPGRGLSAFGGGPMMAIAGRIRISLATFVPIAGVVHAWLYYREAQARQARHLELEARLVKSELDVLRLQLHPHFLFNALHTVSAMMIDDVAGARRVLAALGDLLRHSVEHVANQEVTLRDELAFVTRYLDIQRARFGNRLRVMSDIPAELLDAVVPNLLLQPLVENAVRHGVEPADAPVTVDIRASRREGVLHIVVANAMHTGDAAAGHAAGTGLGLPNIRARLAQLYPGSHAFSCTVEEGQYRARIAIPYRDGIMRLPAAV
jgi:two-component system LytT family sensor kinase